MLGSWDVCECGNHPEGIAAAGVEFAHLDVGDVLGDLALCVDLACQEDKQGTKRGAR